jgi:hypothetical protein
MRNLKPIVTVPKRPVTAVNTVRVQQVPEGELADEPRAGGPLAEAQTCAMMQSVLRLAGPGKTAAGLASARAAEAAALQSN